jgi:hypothetical protein
LLRLRHPTTSRSRIQPLLLALWAGACASPELGTALGDASLDCAEALTPTIGDAGLGDGGPGDGGVPGERPVVVISVDGLRADAVTIAPADTVLDLACRGAYSLTAQTILPSLTLPAHASMVSGYAPEQHGLLHDYMATGYIAVPTLFGLAEEAGLGTVIIVGKQKLVQLAPPGSYDEFLWITEGDAAIVDAAVAVVEGGFDVLFVHLPELDYTGHSSGWMSEEYLARLRTTDAEIARLVDSLPAGTTVIVTADHGGHGTHHGTDAATDTTIPWIIAGPGIPEGRAIEAPISVMDTAATAAFVAGFALEPDAIGRPVEEAFAP